jgi:hypothetical protein
MCVCGGGGGVWIHKFHDWCSHSQIVGHYRKYIISGVGHSRSDSVVPLILWMVAYSDRGTGIVLQVPRDSANSIIP